jgi:hypothetical protein
VVHAVGDTALGVARRINDVADVIGLAYARRFPDPLPRDTRHHDHRGTTVLVRVSLTRNVSMKC